MWPTVQRCSASRKPPRLSRLTLVSRTIKVPVLAKILEREAPTEPEQRMIRMSGRHEGEPHQRLTAEPRRDTRRKREIHAALEQRLRRAAEHRLDHLDACIRRLTSEAVQAFEQQPGRKDDLDGDRDLRLPTRRSYVARLVRGSRPRRGEPERGSIASDPPA